MHGSSLVDVVDFMQVSRQETFRFLRKELEHAQASMKKIVDAHHKDVTFTVGNWVYVKLRPYQQSSVSGHKHHKQGKRYFWPYKIVERVGPVAYKLVLLESSKIHLVFHCSLLKPHFGPIHSDNHFPPVSLEEKPIIQPLVVLDSKWDSSTSPRKLVLVQWLGLQPENSTWEDWIELEDTYHLEDKVFFQGPRGDSNLHQSDCGHRPKRMGKKPQGWEDYVH